jgi:hypothetical protein
MVDQETTQPTPGPIYRLLERIEERLNAFSLWINGPEDMEGVWTRIVTMGVIFGGMILITLTSCLLIYGSMVGWRAIVFG